MSNQKDIEQSKAAKAQLILNKHLDMTLRNRALREKKEKIQQTVKKIELWLMESFFICGSFRFDKNMLNMFEKL